MTATRLIGSSEPTTTTQDKTEIVTYKGPEGTWTDAATLKSLSLTALSDAKININNGGSVYLPANSRLSFKPGELDIHSCVLEGKGIKFVWIATI